MTAPVTVLAALLIAFWDAWRLLGGRIETGVEAVPLLLVLAVATVPLVRRWRGDGLHPLPLAPLCFALALYTLACLFAPALVRIALAALTLLGALHWMATARAPGAPLVGLALLALPVLPSLEFVLAYPLRVASAGITAALLRMNGFPVEVEGVALRWGETLVQFDAACSGVRMLWGALFLVSALALIARLPARRYALLLLAVVPLTIVANALRAASLFYVEAEAAAFDFPAFAHDGIGLATFAMLAGALVALHARLAPAR